MSELKIEVDVKVNEEADIAEPIPVLMNNIPFGGKEGEFLRKKSDAPYDAEWVSPEQAQGGVSKDDVAVMLTEATKNLQPKLDDRLNTNSKSVAEAINEVNEVAKVAEKNANNGTEAIDIANVAKSLAEGSVSKANEAVSIANKAQDKADEVLGVANSALELSNTALGSSTVAEQKSEEALEKVTDAIASSHTVNITDVSKVYDNADELPIPPLQGNGTRYPVLTNGKLPIFLYEYSDQRGYWEKTYQVKGSTIYIDLATNRLYRYIIRAPYFEVLAKSASEIDEAIKAITERLNTVLNSDDVTLDQLSEIVAYIKENKDLIDGVTTSKVNVSDIVNNLLTNIADKPLSAEQGVVLKGMIGQLSESLNERIKKIEETPVMVLVDIEELVVTKDIDRFNELSEKAFNGEIIIALKIETSMFIVNRVDYGGFETVWYFTGTNVSHTEANPTRSLVIGKLLWNEYIEDFIVYVDNIDLGEFLKATDTSKIVKEGLTNSDETFTDDEKQSARDLIGAVGSTDYATASKAGVVKGNPSGGVRIEAYGGGLAYTEKATNEDIDIKSQKFKVIVPNNLDYAVKVGVTTNTEELSDDEKASARNWVGAVGFTDMPSTDGTKAGLYQIRGHGNGGLKVGADGKTEIQPPSEALIKQRCADRPLTPKEIDYIIRYGLTGYKETWNGSLGQMVPSYENYTAFTDEEKGYACNLIGAFAKPTSKPTSMTSQVIVYSPILKTLTYTPMGSTSGGTSGSLVVYSDSATDFSGMISNVGTIYVATPKGAKQTANKDYIDNLPDYLTLTDEQKAKWKAWLQAILS